MISIEKASEIVLNNIKQLKSRNIDFSESLGYITAEDIKSGVNIPSYSNSAMDGYAVKSADVRSTSKKNPVTLKIIDEVPAGKVSGKKVVKGTAVKIMTGAPVPAGADAIVMVEVTKKIKDSVLIYKPVRKYENFRRAGEDFKKGTLLIQKGKKISPADIGLLASIGKVKVKIVPKPSVSIIATGNELVEPHKKLLPGKIRNSNNYILNALVQETGAVPLNLGIAGDTKQKIRKKIEKALKSDVIITSGGVSVGDYDFVKEVLAGMKFNRKIWRVAVKPGKPFLFGLLKNKPLFALPGNPVSSMLSFEMFVRPALLKMMGINKIRRKEVKSKLVDNISRISGRLHLVRAVTYEKNGKYYSRTTGFQGSANITSISGANSLIKIPPGTKKLKNNIFDVILLY